MSGVELPPAAVSWLNLLRESRQAEKDARETAGLAKRNLLALLGENDEGSVAGRPAVRRVVTVRQTLDPDRVRAEFPEVYEKCLRASAVESVRLIGGES